MFSIFNKTKPIEGEIGYFNLQDWWLNTFDEEERKHIEEIFKPLGSGGEITLTKGRFTYTTQTAAGLLHALAGWFNNSQDRNIARKIIQKAYKEAVRGEKILDLHFTLQTIMEIYYRDRDIDLEALNTAIRACEEQIKIAPLAAKAFKKEFPSDGLPAHAGYDQLRIIYKKQGDFQKAIDLCQQAKKQKWCGNWDKQIEELSKKLTY